MIPQASASNDFTDFGEMVAECESEFAEPITIRRAAASQPSTPGASGAAKKAVFTDFPATAVQVEMGVAQKMYAAGVLSAGDLILQMSDRLNEGNENTGGTQLADRVVYRGMEYRMVQRPQPVTMGAGLSPNAQFYIVHLRRTNSPSDVVGG